LEKEKIVNEMIDRWTILRMRSGRVWERNDWVKDSYLIC
jgi:hypothetical protein